MFHTAPVLRVFITAGEASGDALGARLMAALKKHANRPVEFTGVGGPLMQEEGLQSLFPMRELSLMGITEILPKLRGILARIRETAHAATQTHHDIFITIDSPDFSFRVAKLVREAGAPRPLMMHYVAPTVWAWREKRAAKVAGLYDGILCLLPFEPPYFTKEGMSAAFTGHPVLESGYLTADSVAFRRDLGIPLSPAKVLGLLFGSRNGELKRVGPTIRDAALLLAARYPDLHFLAPTLPHLVPQVRELTAGLGKRIHITSEPERKWAAFRAMDVALAVSGTVALELTVAAVPHVIAYKTGWLTGEIVRRQIKVKYAHLTNLLLDEGVIPEFIQEQCKTNDIVNALTPLLEGNTAAQWTAINRVRGLLQGEKNEPPSDQAAHYILDLYLRSLIGT